jgi:hypothetical protein
MHFYIVSMLCFLYNRTKRLDKLSRLHVLKYVAYNHIQYVMFFIIQKNYFSVRKRQVKEIHTSICNLLMNNN